MIGLIRNRLLMFTTKCQHKLGYLKIAGGDVIAFYKTLSGWRKYTARNQSERSLQMVMKNKMAARPVYGVYAGESIVKPVGEVICIRKFPNFSDDTLTNQMLPRPCGPWRRARPLRTLRVGVRKRLVHVSNL